MKLKLAAFLINLPLAAQAPVGLLSSVKGVVQIIRAGSTSPVAAHIADLIGAGDRLITGAGGETVFLFCPESRSARLPASGELAFGDSALQVRKGKLADDRKIQGCRLPSTLALSSASQQQVGLVRTRASGTVVLQSPSRTFISEPRPRFRWLPVEGAKSYTIRVTDREERTLYKAQVNGTQAEYPADAPQLAPGQKYWWRVEARDTDDTLGDTATFFQTLSDSQVKEFRSAEADLKKQQAASPADTGPQFLLAFLYEETGLLEDAARSYDGLIKRLGPNDWLNFRLVTLLNKLGWEKVEK